MVSFATTTNTWYAGKKFLFRFFFVYFSIYCFPFPLDAFVFTDPIARPYYNLLDWLILRLSEKWFHLPARTAFPMFDKLDDSWYGLVFIYLNPVISVIAAICWSVADHKRKNYEKLYQWLRLYLRYFLAAFLFGYGFVKVFPSQFQAISASRLTMTVGDQSPMLLAWNFFGYSVPMMRINGLVEVLAGLLLLFRRTTTVGALLSAGVFSFVVIMDFSYNVPVRLLSSHLLLISVFLVLEDRRRLLNVFFLNKPTESIVYAPLIKHPNWRKVFFCLQVLVAVSLIYSTIDRSLADERKVGRKAPPVPLYGVYNTEYFTRNGDTIPPLETDSLRWKQLVIDGNGWEQTGIIRCAAGKRTLYGIKADTVGRLLRLQSVTDSTQIIVLRYKLLHENRLLLQGKLGQDSVEMVMNKYDLNNYPLHKEKFKWISE